MRTILINVAAAALAIAFSTQAFAQESPLVPIPAQQSDRPLPSLETAKTLPLAQILDLATRTLIGQPRNLDYGFELLLGPALKGDPAAVRLLARAIRMNEYGFGDQTNAVLRALANAAMQGSSGSIVAWALIHDRGVDIPRDETKAYEWYRWAAVLGSDTGSRLTALALAEGKGVAQDKEEALVWANRISLANRAPAYMQLAKVFYNGAPGLQDPELAERLALESAVLNKVYRVAAADLILSNSNNSETVAKAQAMLKAAAADGDLKAQFYISESQPEVDEDEKENTSTDDLYARLAAAGDNDAIRIIAQSLSDQNATAESRAQTMTILKSGAQNGSLEAMKALSTAYFFGLGGPVSFETAATYYRQAADAGDAESQYQLGLMYANAIGLPKDIAQAAFWLKKSADGGYKLAALSLLSLPKAE